MLGVSCKFAVTKLAQKQGQGPYTIFSWFIMVQDSLKSHRLTLENTIMKGADITLAYKQYLACNLLPVLL